MPADRSTSCVTLAQAPQAPQGSPPRDIDWTAVEREYREGKQSLRELASKHGCSHSAIANRAGRLRWERRCSDRNVTNPLVGNTHWASGIGQLSTP